MNEYMKLAIEEAKNGINLNYGGPFGAVVVKDGKVIASACNTVLKDNDPTAHGEINAIRKASKILNTEDLSGCVLYTTAYPCPMCLGAIIWSNIKEVYYGSNCIHTAKIGFRDELIYEYLKGNTNLLDIKQINECECDTLQDDYKGSLY